MNYYPYFRTGPSSAFKSASTIEVFGEGTVGAAPDQAVIVLGAESEGPELQPLQAANAEIMTNIINALLRLNIPRENIQTSDYRIETRYDFEDGRQIFRGYSVTHLLQIRLDEIGQTGTVVDTAVSEGANRVESIRFTIRQPEVYVNQALALALRNARQKAATIAAALGVPLPAVPSLVEELPRAGEPIPFAAVSAFAKSAPTPIEPGELDVRAAVRVTYRIC
ncbi:SIMPL domain-containing protein [Paenibacillus humicola]|uniref:SIMPL domain-containing protein n=1 Tax=Paenibacillus humicola TaxID=3110540 RepID=UPI00237B693A|nr:SIMPL domain-containing protein [Paenibacillus humicola]